MPRIDAASEVMARPSVGADRPRLGGGNGGGGWYGATAGAALP